MAAVDKNSQRLELAVRRNQGRGVAAEFRHEVATSLGVQVDELRVVDLPATDAAFARLLDRRLALEAGTGWARVMVSMRTPSREGVICGLRALREELAGKSLLLHRGLSEVCGAVEAQAPDIIEHVHDLIELDQESVLAADADGNTGLIVEYLTDPIGSGQIRRGERQLEVYRRDLQRQFPGSPWRTRIQTYDPYRGP